MAYCGNHGHKLNDGSMSNERNINLCDSKWHMANAFWVISTAYSSNATSIILSCITEQTLLQPVKRYQQLVLQWFCKYILLIETYW